MEKQKNFKRLIQVIFVVKIIFKMMEYKTINYFSQFISVLKILLIIIELQCGNLKGCQTKMLKNLCYI